MNQFIKLTDKDNFPIFINVHQIIYMYRYDEFLETRLAFKPPTRPIDVLETPEQILELIKATE
ncbi:hypothetical protein BMT54_06295 [Pasteurellaceae bacterium 15-036681]|nr:hypothetical protein BMT54_06295 [Pasteurellaceae bacterium 15-036681]